MTAPSGGGVNWQMGLARAALPLAAVATAVLFLPIGAPHRAGFDESRLFAAAAADGGLASVLGTTSGEMRRPLFWAVATVSGPAALHTVAAALHGLTSLVVAILGVQLVAARAGRAAPFVALAFAAAWAVSPARVSSVADATALGAPLGGLFAALAAAFWCFAQTSSPRPHTTVFLAAGLFGLALLADPSLFPLPVALTAMRAWLRRGEPETRPGARGSLAPLWALAAAALVATLSCRESGGGAPFLPGALAAASALVRPLRAVFWPFGLHPAYDPPPGFPDEIAPTLWVDAATAAALVAGAVLGTAGRRGWGHALVAYLAMAAGAVLLSRRPVGSDTDGYAATVPVFLGAAAAAAGLAARWRTFATIAAALLAAGCCALTAAELRHWTDEASLARHVADVDPANERAAVASGDAARRAGRPPSELDHWYAAPLDRTDWLPLAHARRGAVLLETGDPAAARRHLERAVEIAPWLAAARFDLASLESREGHLDAALAHAEAAARLDASSAEAWRLVARTRDVLGDRPGAADAIARAAALRPDDAALAEEARRLAR